MLNVLSKVFSTKNERIVKSLQAIVNKINGFEQEFSQLEPSRFPAKTAEFKERIKKGESCQKLLPEAFALVREASKRVLKMRHFDVQLIGGIILFQGKIAEMKTGEGKTLVATLTSYLVALEEKGVHVVTVNDHLAKRDAEWMEPIYSYLGLEVGYIVNETKQEQRKAAYAKDITYATNNELGFDYLRDNMVLSKEQQVQREHHFCIVDEVDSILIDEARTPLIISGPSESNISKYYSIDKLIPRLREAQKNEKGREIAGTGDYIIDLKDRNVVITEDGVKTLEGLLNVKNLYSLENSEILHHVSQALKAHKLFSKDVDYLVEDNRVHIIDEFTGRKMKGRRFSDGLHQAIEAKENVNILSENQTIATITFQNYFRMYKRVSGMTGTADTEAEEFKKIYDLEVVVIPTNKKITRVDLGDRIYRTEKEKFNSIIAKVRESYKKGQPVLIGTASVEKSESLSKKLAKNGLQHELLNAKHHEREANIVEKAGQRGSVTIATNMAGRGTDIKLGPGVKEAGGLLIIGSERHDARRIDNQLRGRAGRQGDPGESIFYLSLEDNLLKRFQSERISNLMLKLGMKEGEEIEHPWISKQIEMAQRKVEGRNFDIRKYLLEYDDVMNVQRKYVYKERNTFLNKENLEEEIFEYLEEITETQCELFSEEKKVITDEFYERLTYWLKTFFLIEKVDFDKELTLKKNYQSFVSEVIRFLQQEYHAKRELIKDFGYFKVEKYILLRTLDKKWKEHLLGMDHLREGISLRAYGEKKPLLEFKREGFFLFKDMILSFKFDILEQLFKQISKINLLREEIVERKESLFNQSQIKGGNPNQENYSKYNPFLPQGVGGSQVSQGATKTLTSNQVVNKNKIGRNQPCYCGSGKKYKNCCLRK